MCGIFVSSSKSYSTHKNLKIAKKSLFNRGPDDVNAINPEVDLTMLHTRLAIQDKTTAGRQPMISKLTRYAIVYNGEIYNYHFLKSYLEDKYSFVANSNCDTEILLEGFSLEGKQFIEKIDGIFAFIIFDKEKDSFYVARDALGIKPLLYSKVQDGILFSSDVKTLFQILNHPKPSNKSLVDLISLTFIPEPKTLFDEISYIEPGFLFEIDRKGNFILKQKLKYSLKVACYKPEKLTNTINNLQNLIDKSVRSQLISDANVGLFLSSGIDSSLLFSSLVRSKYDLSLALTLSWKSKANGIDSQEEEKEAAKLVKEYSKFDHIEISPPSSLNSYKKVLNYLVIEGISDPAALATYYLSKVAREKGCKVILAGQGADELFFGYRRHKIISLYNFIKLLPRIKTNYLNSLLSKVKIPIIYSKLRRLIKLVNFFGNKPEELLAKLYTWADRETIKKIFKYPEDSSIINDIKKTSQNKISHEKIEYLDFKYDLKSLNLRYSDRLGMFSSIEIRVPYLSNELINYAKSLPNNLKIKFVKTKYILKKLSQKLLPNFITYRGKTGFSLPLKTLLFNDKEEILSCFRKENSVFNEFYNFREVKKLINDFFNHQHENSQLIFSIYIIKQMFDKYY